MAYDLTETNSGLAQSVCKRETGEACRTYLCPLLFLSGAILGSDILNAVRFC